jgi:hypothetical protein
LSPVSDYAGSAFGRRPGPGSRRSTQQPPGFERVMMTKQVEAERAAEEKERQRRERLCCAWLCA